MNIKIISNFTSKEQILEVISLLIKREKIKHHINAYERCLEYSIKQYWWIKNISIWVHDNIDNKKVFDFIWRWLSDMFDIKATTKAKDFINQYRSANHIVLTALQTSKKNYCTIDELKQLLKWRARNTLWNSIYELKKMWVAFKITTNNEIYLLDVPSNVYIWRYNVYNRIIWIDPAKEWWDKIWTVLYWNIEWTLHIRKPSLFQRLINFITWKR